MASSPQPDNGLVRVAMIDSGVNPAHPHVDGVAGGIRIGASGESGDFLDYHGHGTAVAGAIREKAADAALYAVKVFDRTLSTNIDVIARAFEWCLQNRMDVVNLSLGTHNIRHGERLQTLVEQATLAGVVVVAARSVPGGIAVDLDWQCPRELYRYSGETFFASPYPRPIPGVPPNRNLHGLSFAVANMSGFVARAWQKPGSLEDLRRILTAGAAHH
jgi:subtilisin family serine protease